MEENPYTPPRSDIRASAPAAEDDGWRRLSGRFTIDGHEFVMRIDGLNGREECRMDGNVIAQRTSHWIDIKLEFLLGPRKVIVHSPFFPFLPVQVKVDDQPIVRSLLPRTRAVFLVAGLNVLSAVGVIVGLGLLFHLCRPSR